jgi:polysaccharide biosynthesis protein PslG
VATQPFDVTPYVPANNFFSALAIVARQVISLVSIVPKDLFQLAVSAVTVVVQAVVAGIGSLFGVKPAAAAVTSECAATVGK